MSHFPVAGLSPEARGRSFTADPGNKGASRRSVLRVGCVLRCVPAWMGRRVVCDTGCVVHSVPPDVSERRVALDASRFAPLLARALFCTQRYSVDLRMHASCITDSVRHYPPVSSVRLTHPCSVNRSRESSLRHRCRCCCD